jgi:hypothetical protein
VVDVVWLFLINRFGQMHWQSKIKQVIKLLSSSPSRITANTRLIGAASAWCGGASSTCRKQAY